MAPDKKIRRRMARTTPSTDQTTTDNSIDETCSAPCASRGDHPGDHSSGSKFAEAMNNPDWRRRRGGCSACESTDTTTSDTSGSARRSHEASQTPATSNLPTSQENNAAINPWDFIDSANHLQSSLGSSDIETRDTKANSVEELHATPDRNNLHITESETTEEELNGLCSLLQRTDLIGGRFRNRQVEILQLVPLFSEDDTSSGPDRSPSDDRAYPIARIQRVRKVPRSGYSEQSQRSDQETKHLMGAADEQSLTLTASAPNIPMREKNASIRNREVERLEKARQAVVNDPAVTDIGFGNAQAQSKTTSNTIIKVDQPRTDDELRQRNFAFQKFLQKLQQDKPGVQPEESRNNEEVRRRDEAFHKILKKLQKGSGQQTKSAKEYSADSSAFHQSCPWGSKSNHVPPAYTQRRKFDSSDSGIDIPYSMKSRSKEVSRDSGISVGTNALSQGLNPRAREFLSFGKNFQAASGCQDITNLSNEGTLETMGSNKSNKVDNTTGKTPGRTDSTDPSLACPIMEPKHGDRGEVGTSTLDTKAIQSSSKGQGTLNYTTNMIPTPNFAFNVYPTAPYNSSLQDMCPPGPLAGFGHGSNIANLANLVAPATFANQPYPTTFDPLSQLCGVVPGPLLGSNGPQMPYNPMMGGGYSSRPTPVSKPTSPDPIQQQKYEAYIEWRKVNEPGYALACKSRQQRRAQRGPIP
ncbi:uncharacterized protein QYS62_004697 [Fusarium acuminatum]|uniref:Uncharacterized protein n=1 Tax=Fusarium acuminatum TaxID=5515 RepID=A0ABZ2WUS2_9HYPO